MKPKGRYNIRLAERSGVTVSWVDPTPEHIDVFYRIFTETLERGGRRDDVTCLVGGPRRTTEEEEEEEEDVEGAAAA